MSRDGSRTCSAGVPVRRRRLLASLGAAASVGVAGCSWLPGDGAGTWNEGGPPNRDGWTVTFADRFDAGALDTDVWELGYGPPAQADCAGVACVTDDRVRVDPEANRLVLETAVEGADEIPPVRWDGADWTTGAVATGEAFAQTYGYFEVKARPPVQPGALPAFWMQPTDSNPPEIDVYEVFGDVPRTFYTTTHVSCNDNGAMVGRGAPTTTDRPLDEGFRVFGVRWSPETVTWYLDDEEVHRVEGVWAGDCFTPDPLYLILCTHVIDEDGFAAGAVQGDPDDASYPYTHEFEWVRVWQHEDWA